MYRASGAPPPFGINSQRRRAQVSVSRGLKPCPSELLSHAQDSFNNRPQRQPLLIGSARLDATSVELSLGL